MSNIHDEIKEIFFSHEEIVEASKKIAEIIDQDYKDCEKDPVLVCTLKGGLPFSAELIKHINRHIIIDFIDVASYHGGTESTGKLILRKDVTMDLHGRDVIVVEDIVDTGKTIKHILGHLKERGVRSVEVAALVDKPEARLVDVKAKYVGVISPKEFLVGFGLDYAERYRNLPYIGILKEEMYS
ncbi:hypoxanthine phosphoribosyltransferase [Gemella sp. GL1.1]|nr:MULTISPECIES: hypoxanthine phosphoribosyltransferase [unclassified Gemella]MBF0710374.1 hypoxanthine phosphoribosyltransferase [Gemella sp. GL1.1]NYS27718.1 hypoxanthine phosphoribosyltransferase [Gemella sp. GL1]